MGDYNFDFSFIKSGTPIVTLSAVGIAFNAGSRSLLGHPGQIEIGFDEKALAIAVRPHAEGSSAPAYEFEKRVKDEWIRISMRDFMRFLAQRSGIDFLNRAVQFIPEYDAVNKMLVIVVDNENVNAKNRS